MEMKVRVASLGLSLPKTGFGLNAATAAYITIRNAPGDPPVSFVVNEHLSLGSSSGTIAAAMVWSEWFTVNLSRYPWFHRKSKLIGKRASLHVEGTTALYGDATVTLTIYSEHGHPSRIMERAFVDTHGFQAAATTVTGTVKRLATPEPELMGPSETATGAR